MTDQNSADVKTPKEFTRYLIHSIAVQCTTLPVVYHENLRDLRAEANSIGWTPGRLRKLSEKAIRTKHHHAFAEHFCQTRGRRPIFSIYLSPRRSVCVHFTVEPSKIVIRGYFWDVAPGAGEYDGGYILW